MKNDQNGSLQGFSIIECRLKYARAKFASASVRIDALATHSWRTATSIIIQETLVSFVKSLDPNDQCHDQGRESVRLGHDRYIFAPYLEWSLLQFEDNKEIHGISCRCHHTSAIDGLFADSQSSNDQRLPSPCGFNYAELA